MKLELSKEAVGTFIDAVYAIAVTILALEMPDELTESFAISSFAEMLLEYVLSFLILFALWIQHRRINELNSDLVANTVVWINCVILLLVCLIPRATTLVFNYGGDVTLMQLEASLNHDAGWRLSEIVDLFYIGVVIAADLGLLVLVVWVAGNSADDDTFRIRRSKITVSVLTLGILLLSLLLPLENRYFLLLIPLALMSERGLARLIDQKN
jgi:uncharacterized membrane protein